MNFSLRNLLLVNLFLASSLALLLSDEDSKLKSQAVQLERQRQLIEDAKLFHLPVSQAELELQIQKSKLTQPAIVQRLSNQRLSNQRLSNQR